jgi:hypothetical protein
MDEIESQVAAAFETMLGRFSEQGHPPPYLLVLCSINGVVQACRYTANAKGELEPEWLVTSDSDANMAWPINALLIDANGEAQRGVLRGEGFRHGLAKRRPPKRARAGSLAIIDRLHNHARLLPERDGLAGPTL